MENASFFINSTSDNLTMKPTAPTENRTLDYPVVIVLCIVLGLGSIFGTTGNTLVVSSIIKFENLRAIPDLFIFSLSISDLLVSTLYQPLKAYRTAHLSDDSTVMKFVISISAFLGHVALIASITNMLGVTVERLMSIRFPLKYGLLVTKTRAVVTLICIWVFSIAYGGIWSEDLAPATYLSSYFVAVLLGTILIYVYIFVVASRLEGSVAHVQNTSTREQRTGFRRERKAAKTIAVILGVAIVCWVPLLVVPRVIASYVHNTTYFTILNLLQVLSVCNSSINPYIYCVRSRRYYEAFVKLLGLHHLVKVQAIVAPTCTPRDEVSRTRDVTDIVQPETHDIAL